MKNKKVITLLIIIVLLICLIVSGVISYSSFIKNKEEIDSNNSDIEISTQLLNDYKEGKITTDEYVRYNLYAEYDSSLLNKEYASFNNSQATIHTDELIDKYYEELSNETIRYYLEQFNLKNVTFELDKENKEDNSIAMSNFFIDNVYAASNNVTNLNKAVLSKNGNFVVWYTTTGDSATSYELVKKVADGLENTITKYNELFDVDYKFKSKIISKGKTYKNQLNILENENIDSKYLESAMQVYLVNFTADNPAKYVKGSAVLSELFNKIGGGDDYGSILAPYILIKPSSFTDMENVTQLYNHEVFHHYQHNVLCGTSECTMGSDPFIGEATANWGSSLATEKTNDLGFLNEWAGAARKYSSKLLSDSFVNEHGADVVGYALYVYLYNYSDIVSNGYQKVVKSIYQKDSFKYLQDNATKEELMKIQKNISLKNLSQDYTNKNLQVSSAYNGPIQIKDTIKDSSSFKDVRLNKMGIDYYKVKLDNDKVFELTLIRDNNNVSATMIGKKNNKYSVIESSTLDKNNYKFISNKFKDYDEVYIAVSNILPALENYYSIQVSELPDFEELTSDFLYKSISPTHLQTSTYPFSRFREKIHESSVDGYLPGMELLDIPNATYFDVAFNSTATRERLSVAEVLDYKFNRDDIILEIYNNEVYQYHEAIDYTQYKFLVEFKLYHPEDKGNKTNDDVTIREVFQKGYWYTYIQADYYSSKGYVSFMTDQFGITPTKENGRDTMIEILNQWGMPSEVLIKDVNQNKKTLVLYYDCGDYVVGFNIDDEIRNNENYVSINYVDAMGKEGFNDKYGGFENHTFLSKDYSKM